MVQRSGRAKMPAHAPAAFAGMLALVWLLTIATMVTAAITAKSGASLACYEWPSCDGTFFPSLDDPLLLIHFIHRSLAAFTGLGILFIVIWSGLLANRIFLQKSLAAALLVVGQIGFGALVIILEVTRWSQILHQATGVLLFVLLSSMMWLALRGTLRKDDHLAGLSRVGSTL